MSIRYEPSAAGLSWLTFAQAIDSRTLMEQSLFDMFSGEMKLSINQAKTQAAASLEAGMQEAAQSFNTGMAQLAGAVIGGLTAIGATLKSSNIMGEASDIQASQSGMKIKEVTPKVSDTDLEMTTTTTTLTGKAKITGEVDTNTAAKGNNDPETSKALTKEQKQAVESLRSSASQWSTNGNTAQMLLNQAAQSAGSLASQAAIQRKGQANAEQALAGGLAGVFSSEVSQVANALSSCDSNMQNSNQILQTIVSVSAVRG